MVEAGRGGREVSDPRPVSDGEIEQCISDLERKVKAAQPERRDREIFSLELLRYIYLVRKQKNTTLH